MRFVLVFCLIFILGLVGFSDTYIIVIDTSLSMVRKLPDGRRIYDVALMSLSNSVFSLKSGDVVYIVDFNENVYIRPPIRVEGEHTKEVIYKIMTGTQPYGKWTFTYRMLEEIATLIKVSNIPPDRSKVIIISDGIDDPPIKTKKYSVQLEKLSTLFDKNQLIYYISLEKLISSKTVSPKSELAKQLRETEQIRVIEVSDTNQVSYAVETAFTGGDNILDIVLYISVTTILVVLIGFIVFSNFVIPSVASKKSGITNLICSSAKVKKTIPIKGHKISISGSKGKFVLPGWTYPGEMTIKATMKGYMILFSTTSGLLISIPDKSILSRGMSFDVGNYHFEVS